MSNRIALRVVITALCLVIFSPPCRALEVKKQEDKLPLEFEVASIRPVKNLATMTWGLRFDGDTLRAKNESIAQLVQYAFNKKNSEILWGKVEVPKELFVITGRVSPELAAQLKQMTEEERWDAHRKMVQNLLKTRFNLVSHEELRDRPAYVLSVGKGKRKIAFVTGEEQVIDKEDLSKNKPASSMRSYGDIQDWQVEGLPFSFFLQDLSQELQAPVMDKTNISGDVAFHLRWTSETQGLFDSKVPAEMRLRDNMQAKMRHEDQPSDLADFPAPPISIALKQQLGLVLSSQRMKLPVLVIDHVEFPTDN
jgi:uncharacterized protein (TIGR03435 family)